MKTIKKIKAHVFAGDYFSDQEAFEAIEAYIINTSNSIKNRAEAGRIINDKGMDCGREEEKSDSQIVKECMLAYT